MNSLFNSKNMLDGFSAQIEPIKVVDESSKFNAENLSTPDKNSTTPDAVVISGIPDLSISFGKVIEESINIDGEDDSDDIADSFIDRELIVSRLARDYNLGISEIDHLHEKYADEVKELSDFFNEECNEEFTRVAVNEKSQRELDSIIKVLSRKISASIIGELKGYTKDSYSKYKARQRIAIHNVSKEMAKKAKRCRDHNEKYERLSPFSEVSDIKFEINEISDRDVTDLMSGIYYKEHSFIEFIKLIKKFSSKDEPLFDSLSQIIDNQPRLIGDGISFHANDAFLV